LSVTVALEFIVDLMCLEIFLVEESGLRTLLPRKRGRVDTLIGVSSFYSLPVLGYVGAETTSGLSE